MEDDQLNAATDELLEKYDGQEIPDEELLKLFDGEAESGQVEEAKVEAQPEPESEVQAEPEKIILAKDNTHTLPYSELEKAIQERDAALAQLAQIQADNKEPSILDQLSGMDKDELEDFKADYPDIAKLLEQVTTTETQNAAITAQNEAQTSFDAQIASYNPNYLNIKDSDAFWNWFEQQPPHIQAVQSSGNPEAIASVVTLFEQANSDSTPTKGPQGHSVEEVKAQAKEKASVESLTDLAGASSPSQDVGVEDMSEEAIFSRMYNMTDEQREQFCDLALA